MKSSRKPSEAGARDGRPLIVMIQAKRGRRGPPRTLLALAGHLAGKWDVLVAAPEGFLLRAVREQIPQAQVLPIPVARTRSASWARRLAMLANRLGEERRPLLIHANGLSALNLAAPLARRFGAPVFVHFHAFEVLSRSRMLLRLWSLLGVRMRFFAVSDFSRGLLEATRIRSFVGGVLSNPFDCSAFRARRSDSPGAFRIGFVGGRSSRKGLHVLIDVADRLRNENVEWHLFGIDPGKPTPYLEFCRRRIDDLGLGDRMVWRGKFEDAGSVYASVDALLIASSQESFCRVAVEAMASELPVVATRIPGLSEVVWDGVSGYLFDPRRPGEAADHLRRIAHDQELRRRIATNARRAADRFDISAVGRELETRYVELLNGHATSARSWEQQSSQVTGEELRNVAR